MRRYSQFYRSRALARLRALVCLIRGHKWAWIRTEGGFDLSQCQRCWKYRWDEALIVLE